MLKIDDIHVYYGDSYVLQGVSLTVNEGEIVALLGRNGAGKTTTMRSIAGYTRRPGERLFSKTRSSVVGRCMPTSAPESASYRKNGRFSPT